MFSDEKVHFTVLFAFAFATKVAETVEPGHTHSEKNHARHKRTQEQSARQIWTFAISYDPTTEWILGVGTVESVLKAFTRPSAANNWASGTRHQQGYSGTKSTFGNCKVSAIGRDANVGICGWFGACVLRVACRATKPENQSNCSILTEVIMTSNWLLSN